VSSLLICSLVHVHVSDDVLMRAVKKMTKNRMLPIWDPCSSLGAIPHGRWSIGFWNN
jgi:hypothetical protein